MLREAGTGYSVENPLSSYVWLFPPFEQLRATDFTVDFDQCEYGLQPPPSVNQSSADTGGPGGPWRIKKSTRIVLSGLARACQGCDTHFRCQGKVKTEKGWVDVARSAGAYPQALCTDWAALVVEWVARPGAGSSQHK